MFIIPDLYYYLLDLLTQPDEGMFPQLPEQRGKFRQERLCFPFEIAPVQRVVTGDIEEMPGEGPRVA